MNETNTDQNQKPKTLKLAIAIVLSIIIVLLVSSIFTRYRVKTLVPIFCLPMAVQIWKDRRPRHPPLGTVMIDILNEA